MNKEIEDSRPCSSIGEVEYADINQMVNLLVKFEDVNKVLNNAALTAALMNFIFHNSLEYYSLLFYFTVKKYIRINETKNPMRNYNHLNMEIFTVFIHPKSILPVTYKNAELFDKIEEHINSRDCIVYYHKMSTGIVRDVISKYLDKFKEHIKSGNEVFCYTNKINLDIAKETELEILEVLQKSIHTSLIRSQKSRCLPSHQQDIKNLQIMYDFQICALIKAMNTQFEQFVFSKRYSLMMSQPPVVVSTNTFLSSPTVKSSNKQRTKGHCFESDSLTNVSFCLVCDIILWGPHPHCLRCRNCKKAIHTDCKEMVRICQIETEGRKKSVSTCISTCKETSGQNLLNNMTKGLTKIIDDRLLQNDVIVSNDLDLTNESSKEKPKIAAKPTTGKILELKKHYSPSLFTEMSRKCVVKYTGSMKDRKKSDLENLTRSKSARSPSPERFFKDDLTKILTKFPSEDSGLAASVEPLPTSQIDTDDEMQVSESFQPEIELKRFSRVLKNTGHSHQADDHRLLVLMEFHHNIKFIRMTLKRFLYVLVNPWHRMNEHLHLFELLSLDCIEKLYKLIGSLVDVIDSCETDQSYDSTMAEKVLHWMSKDDENNLVSWLQLSANLCCTNTLHSVKAVWMEHKQMYSKLNELFSCEVNRLVIIDQLSNMRPLLFNLPMIVTKIIKDLKKFTPFKEEVCLWKEVHDKISRLPKLIDERCMPVVHLINNGLIPPAHMKYKKGKNGHGFGQHMEFYIDNFPNSIFKNNFLDFQFVKISYLSQSNRIDTKIMVSLVFVKEDTDAAVICYDNELIFLQKENETYLMKNFKSLGTESRKMSPVINFENLHLTKQTNKDNKEFRHQLSILVIDEVVLAQINFKSENIRDMWFNMIRKAATTMKTEKDQIVTCQCDNVADEVDGNVVIKNSEFIPQKNEIIRSQLNQSVNHLMSTFDLISNELSTDVVPDGAPKILNRRSPISSNQFIVSYVDILKEYTLVAEEMITHSRVKDSRFMVTRSDITPRTSRLKDITKQMENLIQSFEQSPDEVASSGDSTLEDESPDCRPTERQTIESYIEEVITEALNKIQYNSKSNNLKKG